MGSAPSPPSSHSTGGVGLGSADRVLQPRNLEHGTEHSRADPGWSDVARSLSDMRAPDRNIQTPFGMRRVDQGRGFRLFVDPVDREIVETWNVRHWLA